jgi:hypothetical protein
VTTKGKSLFLFLFLGVLIALPALSQAQNLREYVAIDSLSVGDTFLYTIALDRDQQYDKISFPDSSAFGSIFEIRSRQQFRASSYKDSVAYELQFFGTADTTIPRLPVYLVEEQDTTTLYTNPVIVNFSSVLAEDEQTFRPLKPIFDFARAWWPYILGLIVLAIIGYYLYQKFVKEQEKQEQQEQPTFTPEAFVNPLKEYQKAIKELEQKELQDQEDFKTFYIDLGDAIRQYYESLYNIPALESTSRELLEMLRNGSVDDNLVDDTRAVLQEADMVKFAKFQPTTDQADRALAKARDFLDRAREIDGPRIEHLRRKHQTRMEAERQQFYEDQQQDEEVKA